MSTALRDELRKRATDGPGTQAQQLARRLLHLALTAKPFEAIAAAKLLLAYVEGQPVQLVELQIREEAERLAAARGLDAQRLIARAEQIVAEAARR